MVVLINLALVYFWLIALPAAFGITLGLCYLCTPDLTSIALASAGIALAWCVIRTVLVIRSYRAFGRPAASAT